MILLLAAVEAHVPHQQVSALLPAEDLAEEAPCWALVAPYATSLMRSDDGGRTWLHVGGPPLGDGPRALARTSEGTLVVLGESAYWWSEDEGVSWEKAALPGPATALAADGAGILLGGATGIWSLQLGGAAFRESTDGARCLRGGVGIDAAGRVTVRTGGRWTPLPATTSLLLVAVSGNDLVYAGTTAGTVEVWDGQAWRVCADLATTGEAHGDVVALTLDGTRLVAGTGLGGPHVGNPSCTRWTETSTPVATAYGGNGGASSENESVTGLFAAAGRYALRAWHSAPTLATALTRGAAATNTGGELPRILLGFYGSALEPAPYIGRSL